MRFPCELPTYHARRMDSPSVIDGDIDKPAWQSVETVSLAPAIGEAKAGAAAAAVLQPTALRVGWTETHLCIAFHCSDREIWGTYRQRDDALYEEEVVEAFLSPTADVAHYYEFEVSPHNVVFDARVTSPDLDRTTMTVDTSWDCPGLQTAVQVSGPLHDGRPSDGASESSDAEPGWWSVEIAIPFAAFPETGVPQPGEMWRANFYRIDRAEPPEYSAWSPTLQVPADFHIPARFGYLVFEA